MSAVEEEQNAQNVQDTQNLTPTPSGSNSFASTPSNKADAMENKDQEEDENYVAPAEMPRQPASAYVTISIMCVMIAFGGFVFGWDTGTISGFVNETDYIRRFGQVDHHTGERYLSRVRMGLMVSIFNIGCCVGGITLSKTGDMWGRRIGLIIVVTIYTIGIVIQIASINKWFQYFIGRIVAGLGVGGIAVLSPMLISEVSPKHFRGTLISCFQLMITAGIFLGYCTNYGTKTYSNSVQWRVPLGLCFAWSLFMIGGMLFVPDLHVTWPRLVDSRRPRDPFPFLTRFQSRTQPLPLSWKILQAAIEAERLAGNASWAKIFSPKVKVVQRLIMGMMIQSLQQLTGDNYFFYYGTTIFKSSVWMTPSRPPLSWVLSTLPPPSSLCTSSTTSVVVPVCCGVPLV